MRRWIPPALGFLLLVLLPLHASAAELRVGVVNYPPFGIREGDQFKGICLDIWKSVADSAGISYRLVPVHNISETLDRIARGDLDAAIGPISITSERLKRVSFTQPFYRAKIGVLVQATPPTLWQRAKPFFRVAVLASIGLFVLALFVFGNLIWLAERRKNESQFPSAYLPGVGNGMWFALVTLTTVGYGDRVPLTRMGRTLSGVWMVITMLSISSLTAGLASAFTLFFSYSDLHTSTFASAADLEGRRVAVVTGTTSAEWAGHYHARRVETSSLDQAVELLAAGKVEGVVFGIPLLKYYLKQHPRSPFSIASFSLAAENYGFPFQVRSPLLQKINIALTRLHETGRIQQIEADWLD